MKIFKLGTVSLLATVTLFAGTYNLDIAHSSVGFTVKHMMISNVKGQFNKFNGSFIYDKKTKILKSLNGTVDTASVDTKITKRDNHLRSADFFNVKKYPTMSFTLDKVKGDTAYGKLTLHGITKEIKLELEKNGTITDPWGNTRTGLSLNGKINREDFGLKWNKIIEAGGVVVGNTIKINIELEGILAK